MELFDSHCHLDHQPLLADRAELLARARAAGVTRICNIISGYDLAAAQRAIATAAAVPGVVAAIGVHPHEARHATPELLAGLERLAADRLVVAWGEIGLDYFYDHSPRPTQRSAFEAQLEIARRLDLPITLHVRDAAADLLELIAPRAPLRGIWHCFSEGPEIAERALSLGLALSFSGVVTYKKAETLRAALKIVPLDRLLLETDAPFLAPLPHRGKRNEPAFLALTARSIAETRGEPLEVVARATTENARRIYSGSVTRL